MAEHSIVLRLAGPLQSWGSSSRFNHRDTNDRPTKSGVVGLLAAALGRKRREPIDDLTELALAVRIDQAGELLRDFHTLSDLWGRPLLSASVNAKGEQKPNSSKKSTHVTVRYYLQDAVFVAVLGGGDEQLELVAEALRHPVFPLALGRRSCVPSGPLLLRDGAGSLLWPGNAAQVIQEVPWQAADAVRRRLGGRAMLEATVDEIDGVPLGEHDRQDVIGDVPVRFVLGEHEMSTRRVRHTWVDVRDEQHLDAGADHDPFALLGW